MFQHLKMQRKLTASFGPAPLLTCSPARLVLRMHVYHSTFYVPEMALTGRGGSVFPLQLAVRCINVAESLNAVMSSAF